MTMFKTQNFKTQELKDQTIRALNDAELDAVTGGSIDSWLAGQPTHAVPPLDLGWTFKDLYAKHTIGR